MNGNSIQIIITGPPRAGKSVLLITLYDYSLEHSGRELQGAVGILWDTLKNKNILPRPTALKAPEEIEYKLELRGGTRDVKVKSVAGETLYQTDTEPKPDVLVVVINPYLWAREEDLRKIQPILAERALLEMILFHQTQGLNFLEALRFASRVVMGWPIESFDTALKDLAGVRNHFIAKVLEPDETGSSPLRKARLKKTARGQYSLENYEGPDPAQFSQEGTGAAIVLDVIRSAARAEADKYRRAIGVVRDLIKRHFPNVILFLSSLDLEELIHCATPVKIDQIADDLFQGCDRKWYHVVAGGSLQVYVETTAQAGGATTAPEVDRLRSVQLHRDSAIRLNESVRHIIEAQQAGHERQDEIQVLKRDLDSVRNDLRAERRRKKLGVNWTRVVDVLAVLLPTFLLLALIVGFNWPAWFGVAIMVAICASVSGSLVLSDDWGPPLENVPRKFLYSLLFFAALLVALNVVRLASNFHGVRAILADARRDAAVQALSDAKANGNRGEKLAKQLVDDVRVQQFESSNPRTASYFDAVKFIALRTAWHNTAKARQFRNAKEQEVEEQRADLATLIDSHVTSEEARLKDKAEELKAWTTSEKPRWDEAKAGLVGVKNTAGQAVVDEVKISRALLSIQELEKTKPLLAEHPVAKAVSELRVNLEQLKSLSKKADEETTALNSSIQEVESLMPIAAIP
jgi:hypothetical protein